MIHKIKTFLLTASLLFGVMSVPAAFAPLASAETEVDIAAGLCEGTEFEISTDPSGTAACGSSGTSVDGINALLKQVVNIISAIVGVVAVIMIIVGGFKYITSGGDSSNVSGAKNTIIYAIIGLIIVALAQLIVRFVLTQASNVVG